MAFANLTLPANRLVSPSASVVRYDFFNTTADPELPRAFSAISSQRRYLTRVTFYRQSVSPLTATTSRQITYEFDNINNRTSRVSNVELSSDFESQGGIVLTSSDGKVLPMLGSPATVDSTEPYAWTVDGDETEFNHEAFDAMFDALRASVGANSRLSMNMLIHDGNAPTGLETSSDDELTFTVPGDNYTRISNSQKQWSFSPLLNVPSGTFNDASAVATISSLQLTSVGEGDFRVAMNASADLSAAFEQRGVIEVTYLTNVATLTLSGADSTQPYQWRVGAGEISAWETLLTALPNQQNAEAAVTLKLSLPEESDAAYPHVGATEMVALVGSTEMVGFIGSTQVFG